MEWSMFAPADSKHETEVARETWVAHETWVALESSYMIR